MPTSAAGGPQAGRRTELELLVGLTAALLTGVAFYLFPYAKPRSSEAAATPTGAAKVDPKAEKENVVNSIGMQFVKIPAGKFLMGSPEEEEERFEIETQHPVTLTKPFLLGIYPVTQEEYEKVMKTNPSKFKDVTGQNTRRFPVETVSWQDAQKFCTKLSALSEEKKAGRRYRLPTEAEWEYACRAGTATPFHFGKILNGNQANCDGGSPYGTGEKGPYLASTWTVGSYPPNAFGLYDMHGNVLQWCADWYDENYYRDSPGEDPRGPETGARRVTRGGACFYDPENCRAAHRGWYLPASRFSYIGFRVALRLD